jgi:hypothetical protein
MSLWLFWQWQVHHSRCRSQQNCIWTGGYCFLDGNLNSKSFFSCFHYLIIGLFLGFIQSWLRTVCKPMYSNKVSTSLRRAPHCFRITTPRWAIWSVRPAVWNARPALLVALAFATNRIVESTATCVRLLAAIQISLVLCLNQQFLNYSVVAFVFTVEKDVFLEDITYYNFSTRFANLFSFLFSRIWSHFFHSFEALVVSSPHQR